ncbi:diverse immunoglobulin domain-containing protein 3.3 [Pimephales promelas]|nr:diverse immunoglobulin domain-containing protein 3.3 [Pimephales promelas]
MSDQCDLCLLGLIILSSLLTGTSGVDDDDHVFISSGVDVRLSCNNALSDCKSTTWTYSSFRRPVVVGLIELGIKNKDTERHERLSLESDCSLNIKNVTEEDYGLYICQQYENDRQQGTDARVYLHVLHVSVSPSSSSSSSSSQTEISPGHSVTLYCQLYSYSGLSCDDRISPEGFELLWVNQTGVDLKTDSRYQISSSSSSSSSSSPDRCIITLTTTLLNEDNNRVWRCQLTHRNQLQTSSLFINTDSRHHNKLSESRCNYNYINYSNNTSHSKLSESSCNYNYINYSNSTSHSKISESRRYSSLNIQSANRDQSYNYSVQDRFDSSVAQQNLRHRHVISELRDDSSSKHQRDENFPYDEIMI